MKCSTLIAAILARRGPRAGGRRRPRARRSARAPSAAATSPTVGYASSGCSAQHVDRRARPLGRDAAPTTAGMSRDGHAADERRRTARSPSARATRARLAPTPWPPPPSRPGRRPSTGLPSALARSRVQVEVERRGRAREVGALADHDVAAVGELRGTRSTTRFSSSSQRPSRDRRLRLGVGHHAHRVVRRSSS